MFNGKYQVSDIKDVPATWIFEHYLGLQAQLNGQTIRLNSFDDPDGPRLPLSLYYDVKAGTYRWKDWVTGKGGSAVDLMMNLWKSSFRDAANRIEGDYYTYCLSGQAPDKQVELHTYQWKLVHYTLRGWTEDDAKFWPQFNISSELLEEHCVRPLLNFTMEQFVNGVSSGQKFQVDGKCIYGYFSGPHCPEGDFIYKTYQPLNPDKKFMKVGNYLQGLHQLKGYKYLCITSSMKDLLACKSLGLKVDFIAPDSENNLLSLQVLQDLITQYQYQGVCTLLDNDTTGIDNMKKYRDLYGVHPCYLPLKKDPSDSIKFLGTRPVLERLAPGLQRACELFTGLLLST